MSRFIVGDKVQDKNDVVGTVKSRIIRAADRFNLDDAQYVVQFDGEEELRTVAAKDLRFKL